MGVADDPPPLLDAAGTVAKCSTAAPGRPRPSPSGCRCPSRWRGAPPSARARRSRRRRHMATKRPRPVGARTSVRFCSGVTRPKTVVASAPSASAPGRSGGRAPQRRPVRPRDASGQRDRLDRADAVAGDHLQVHRLARPGTARASGASPQPRPAGRSRRPRGRRQRLPPSAAAVGPTGPPAAARGGCAIGSRSEPGDRDAGAREHVRRTQHDGAGAVELRRRSTCAPRRRAPRPRPARPRPARPRRSPAGGVSARPRSAWPARRAAPVSACPARRARRAPGGCGCR